MSRHGVRIPFTSYRIPIPIFVTGLITIFGTPATANKDNQPIENSVQPNVPDMMAGRRNIIPGFQKIVTSVLNEVLTPRLSLVNANKFVRQDPTAVVDVIHIGIKTKLSEKGPGEDQRYFNTISCFKSRMDKLGYKFEEEYRLMWKFIEKHERSLQCYDSLGKHGWSTLLGHACAPEISDQIEAGENHKSSHDGLTQKLKEAAECCAKDTNPTLKCEVMMTPSSAAENRDEGKVALNHHSNNDGLTQKPEDLWRELFPRIWETTGNYHIGRSPHLKSETIMKGSVKIGNGAALPSFRKIVTYRLRQFISLEIMYKSVEDVYNFCKLNSLTIYDYNLKKALSLGVEGTFTNYGLQSNLAYLTSMKCFNARMDQYSQSKEYRTWDAFWDTGSIKYRECIESLEPKERQQVELLKEKWYNLVASYAKSFESSSLEIPETFEKEWPESEAQKLASNEQVPCGSSFAKVVEETTLYYFKSITISAKLEGMAEDCQLQTNQNLCLVKSKS